MSVFGRMPRRVGGALDLGRWIRGVLGLLLALLLLLWLEHGLGTGDAAFINKVVSPRSDFPSFCYEKDKAHN
jgi:hypothetical protein